MLRENWETDLPVGAVNEQIFDSSRPFVIQGYFGACADRSAVSGNQRLTFPGPGCHINAGRRARELGAGKLVKAPGKPASEIEQPIARRVSKARAESARELNRL
jgi:hypothetical protein